MPKTIDLIKTFVEGMQEHGENIEIQATLFSRGNYESVHKAVANGGDYGRNPSFDRYEDFHLFVESVQVAADCLGHYDDLAVFVAARWKSSTGRAPMEFRPLGEFQICELLKELTMPIKEAHTPSI